MSFKVEIEKFDGPLDLMLHLIREQQLDIFDLDMEVLTDQYIAYLHQMENLHLEIESEYLVELTTLIEYKSKKLLPKPADALDGEYEEDPKERLVRRLIEYQQFKEVSKELYENYIDRQDQLAKAISYEDVKKNSDFEDTKLEGNPYDLLKAMNKVMRRIQLTKPFKTKLAAKELSTDDRVLQIKARFNTLPTTFSFTNLLDDCHELAEYIVTFLAILEMAKDHYLVFSIDENDEIWFTRGSNND